MGNAWPMCARASLLLGAMLLTVVPRGVAAYPNARSLGMAGAYTVVARNLDAVDWNPASLALRSPYRVCLGLGLLPSFSGGLRNSVLSTDLIRDYEGKYLTQRDKDDILDLVADGLRARGDFAYEVAGVSVGRMGFRSSGEVAVDVQCPDAPIRLLLEGTALGDSILLHNASGKMLGVLVHAFSYAYPLHDLPAVRNYLDRSPVPILQLAGGATVKLLSGLGYFELKPSRGALHIGDSYVDVGGRLDIRAAGLELDLNESEEDTSPVREGERIGVGQALFGGAGWGLGVDLGLSAVLPHNVTVGLAITNALGAVRWTRDTFGGSIRFHADSLNVVTISADTTGGDSLLTASSSSQRISSFTTDCPTYLSVGVAYTMGMERSEYRWLSEGVTLSADYRTSGGGFAGSRSGRLALGVENRLLRGHLPVRCGMALGSRDNRAVSIGMGVHFRNFQWDVAVLNRGSILGAPLGGEMGTMFRITF